MTVLELLTKPRSGLTRGVMRGAASAVEVHSLDVIGYPHNSLRDALQTDVAKIRGDVEKAKKKFSGEAR